MPYSDGMDHMTLETPGERLRWARQRAGFKTAKDAARAARIGEVSFRAYENSQHGFSKHATKFAKAFGVPVDWLLDGGPMPEGDSSKPGEIGTPTELADYGIELVRKVDITYAMGDGSIIEDYPETDYLPFSLGFLQQFSRGSTDDLFIAIGQGDSMEPTIYRNDLVMVDTAQNRITQQDQIWALSYAGTGMIKRVRRLTEGRMQLLSDNAHVPPLDAMEDEIYIVGRVVWSARMM